MGVSQFAAPRLIVPLGQDASIRVEDKKTGSVNASVNVAAIDSGWLELRLDLSRKWDGKEMASKQTIRVHDGEPELVGILGFSATDKEIKKMLVLVSATRAK